MLNLYNEPFAFLQKYQLASAKPYGATSRRADKKRTRKIPLYYYRSSASPRKKSHKDTHFESE